MILDFLNFRFLECDSKMLQQNSKILKFMNSKINNLPKFPATVRALILTAHR